MSGGAREGGAFPEGEWGTRSWFEHLSETQGFDDPAAYYGHQASGYQRRRHAVICDSLKRAEIGGENVRLLDIGCGSGDLTNRIARTIGSDACIGIDFVDSVIAKARMRYPHHRFEVGELMDMDFPDNSFDLVVASEVLYYLSDEMRVRWLEEISRLLEPKGTLLFTSVLGNRYFTRENVRSYFSERFEYLCENVEYYKLYHWITSPFVRARLLLVYLLKGVEPGSEGARNKLRKITGYMRLPGAMIALELMGWVGGLVLRSESLPRICEWINSRVFPFAACETNLLVLARKP